MANFTQGRFKIRVQRRTAPRWERPGVFSLHDDEILCRAGRRAASSSEPFSSRAPRPAPMVRPPSSPRRRTASSPPERRGAIRTSTASGRASTWSGCRCSVPALYGGRLFMTAQEHAVLEKQEQERIVQMANEGAGGATGAPGSLGGVGQVAASDVAHRRSSGRPPAGADPRRAGAHGVGAERHDGVPLR